MYLTYKKRRFYFILFYFILDDSVDPVLFSQIKFPKNLFSAKQLEITTTKKDSIWEKGGYPRFD